MDSFRDTKALKYLRPSQVGPMAAGLSAFGASELPAVEEPSTIWIPDDKLGYKLANVVERSDAGVVVKAKNKENVFEEMDIPSDETQEVNPSAFELCEDMASLTHLNEASVLHNLRQRFLLDLIHTFSGLFCVTINPWRWLPIYTDQVVQLYTGAQEHTPPHVFAIAQTAYSGILKGGGDQSILITGESGAGKTENTKKIIQYFTVVAGGGMSRMCKSATFNSALSSSSLEEQIAEMNPLLESFGNAKTTQNDNSSRFGKFIRIKFGSDGIVVGTEIESYLLEKSRVVSQNVSERSFHIFYQLLSEGFPASLKQALNLRMPASSYRFINRGGPDSDQVDSINDAVDAQHTDRALNTLGFSPDEKLYLYQMVAACLLMGQLKFTERTGFDQTFIDGTAEANDVCALIGLKTNRFVDGLTEPTMKVGDQLIRKSQNLEKTLFSVSAVAKSVYERTFKWIVTKCNSSLRAKGAGKQSLADGAPLAGTGVNDIRRCRFIGVLDMAGFEILSINSFEQLCINFTNERLQQFFNHFMFIREQSEYDAEQIQWDYIDFGLDLQPAIDLIEKPLGLLSLLEEECVVPKGSDLSLAEKLCQAHLGKSAPFGKPRPSQKSRGVAHFSIAHYAGVVSYNIDGWLDKNRDPLSESLLEMLAGSTHPLMQQIFKIDPQTAALGRRRRQSLASLTVSSVYKDQLGNLLSTLNSTNPHFIRCIVPNYERMPGLIDGPLVLQQLRCNGVLEGIRICRRGYPNRLLFEEFVNRYRILHPKSTDGCSNDWKRAAEQLCEAIGLVPHTQYQLGVTKVFCRVGLIGQLESMRNEKLSKLVCGLQARIRWYFEQIELDNRYAEWEALLLIQKAVRHHVVVRKWPWYRLMQLVAPMVPKEREKVMIEDLTVERDALKELVGRLEGENADLINKVRSLEKRVSEMLDVNRRQDCEIETMREEMQKQEDLLATLQHNLSEQEHKLMNLHSTLSEEQSRIQELRDGNALLEKDMESMKQSLQKERGAREQMELNQKLAHVQLKEMEEALTETESVKISLESQLEMREKENEELKARVNQQLETIKSMQSQIFDQSSRVSAAESQLHAERMAKKKAENEKLITDEVIADLQKSLDHAEKKAALLKEKWRVKDVEVGKLNKKLTDSTDQLDFCVSDMKKRHAATHKVLQDQLEEYRRKSLKLESENKQLKAKVEVSLNSFERESSIDSDYGSGARILSRRHTTQNSHSSMRRSQTHLDSLSFHAKVREEISTLTQRFTKSGSSNDMQNRRLDELERELRSVQTDKRLLTREIDVYKRTIHDETLEKEALSKQVKGLVVDVNQLNKALMKEEEHSIDLERKLRKTQNDVTHYKAKYEDTLVEKDNEVNLERKRMQQKLDEVVHEHQLKSNQIAIVHKTKDELQTELVETQAELDRAYASIAQLEKLHDSQGKVADTWGTQYKMASGELEALREENNNLRTRLRRQQRELDTLRETSTPDNEANMLEGEIQRLRDELMSSSTISQEDGVSPSNSSSSVHTRRSSIYGNRYED